MPSKKKDIGANMSDNNGKPETKLPSLPETSTTVLKDQKYEELNFVDTSQPVWNYSLLNDEDVANYQNGSNYQLYKKFGSHSIQVNDVWGMYFCVWAPNATSVSVKGNFND